MAKEHFRGTPDDDRDGVVWNRETAISLCNAGYAVLPGPVVEKEILGAGPTLGPALNAVMANASELLEMLREHYNEPFHAEMLECLVCGAGIFRIDAEPSLFSALNVCCSACGSRRLRVIDTHRS